MWLPGYLCQRADKGNNHLETMASQKKFGSQIEACSNIRDDGTIEIDAYELIKMIKKDDQDKREKDLMVQLGFVSDDGKKEEEKKVEDTIKSTEEQMKEAMYETDDMIIYSPSIKLGKGDANLISRICQTSAINECAFCRKVSSLRCARCKKVFYCCKEHQKSHWKAHKSVCKHV